MATILTAVSYLNHHGVILTKYLKMKYQFEWLNETNLVLFSDESNLGPVGFGKSNLSSVDRFMLSFAAPKKIINYTTQISY